MTTHEIKPVRRGRLAGTGDWRQQYAALRVSAEEAAAQIHNCDAQQFVHYLEGLET